MDECETVRVEVTNRLARVPQADAGLVNVPDVLGQHVLDGGAQHLEEVLHVRRRDGREAEGLAELRLAVHELRVALQEAREPLAAVDDVRLDLELRRELDRALADDGLRQAHADLRALDNVVRELRLDVAAQNGRRSVERRAGVALLEALVERRVGQAGDLRGLPHGAVGSPALVDVREGLEEPRLGRVLLLGDHFRHVAADGPKRLEHLCEERAELRAKTAHAFVAVSFRKVTESGGGLEDCCSARTLT